MVRLLVEEIGASAQYASYAKGTDEYTDFFIIFGLLLVVIMVLEVHLDTCHE